MTLSRFATATAVAAALLALHAPTSSAQDSARVQRRAPRQALPMDSARARVGDVPPPYGRGSEFPDTEPRVFAIPMATPASHRAAMPRYRRYFENGQTVFLTLATAHRNTWLARVGARDSVLAALRETRMRLPFVHHGHVLLDDHLHLLIAPAPGADIPRIVGNFKRAAALGLANAGIVDHSRL